jgi:hypothetical protein
MSQGRRLFLGLIALAVISAAVLVLEMARRRGLPAGAGPAEVTLTSGSVPIYLDGRLAAGFSPADLERLEVVSFVDAEEGKLQDGWLLRQVLSLYLPVAELDPQARVEVSSSSRGKAIQLTWAEVQQPENMVMFDLSNRGTLKLVSKLERLDTRDEWVQDANRIEVTR